MITELQLKNYLSHYFTEVLSYLQSDECKEMLSTAIANILHWVINYMLIPIGALIVYAVICTFNSVTDVVTSTTVKPVTSIADMHSSTSAPTSTVEPMSDYWHPQSKEVNQVRTEVHTETTEESPEDVPVKRITSYQIESVFDDGVHDRESDFGEGYFTNLGMATEEDPF